MVVRSTWDYPPRRDAFLDWADRVARVTKLANPPDLLRWNTDKRYLRELHDGGVPIVPTAWIEPHDEPQLPETGEFVVKPAISAGARDTARYEHADRERALRHVNSLLAAGRTVMVQPYIDAVDEVGETAVVFAGGAYSHAIRKGPILRRRDALVSELFAEEAISPRAPSSREREVAELTLDAVPGERRALLYARVDLVPGDDAQPLLLELEVTEPSLFLDQADGAAERFADAIVRAL